MEDSTISVVVDLYRGVNPADRLYFMNGAVCFLRLYLNRLAWLEIVIHMNGVLFCTIQPEAFMRLSIGKLQRQNAHTHQVRTVNPLVGGCYNRLHTQQNGSFAAQSREDPLPYSLPTSAISGVSSSLYL